MSETSKESWETVFCFDRCFDAVLSVLLCHLFLCKEYNAF